MMVALLLPVGTGELKLTARDPQPSPASTITILQTPSTDSVCAPVSVSPCHWRSPTSSRRLSDHPGSGAADVASDAALDDWLRREVTTYSHISGTCKMGPGADAMAVIDQYGKVHGLEGLRIVNASSMPNLVRAPINPTVLMMAERIAALIQQEK